MKTKTTPQVQTAQAQSPQKSPVNPEMRVTPGPLGRKRSLLNKKSPSAANPHPSSNPPNPDLVGQGQGLGGRRLQDVQILPIFETVMQDTAQKSAIIFSQAEDLREFDNRRELFGRLVDWSRLPPWNRNLCILVFHHEGP